jgi:hypothetical protein
MSALHALSAAGFGMIALFATSQANAQERFNVCVGEGDGGSCQSATSVNYTCSEYKGIGGGGLGTIKALGERLCKYVDGGQEKSLLYSVANIYSVEGGQCGWTLFAVTCFPPR